VQYLHTEFPNLKKVTCFMMAEYKNRENVSVSKMSKILMSLLNGTCLQKAM
jgi:hypothetical protein